MKKLVMILLMMILTTGAAQAVEKIGVWKEMPITVYIE